MRAAAREPADRVVRGGDRWLARSRGSASSRIPARRTTGTHSGRSPRSTPRRSPVWHDESDLAGPRRRGVARRLLVRRLPPLRSDRPLLAGDGRGARVRRRRRARARDLQRLPDPLRGRACCPGALLRNESLRFVCRDVPLRGRAGRPAFHDALQRRRSGSCIPVKHGDGRYVPPLGSRPGAGRAPLPRQPERLGRRHRRRLQRGAGTSWGLMPHPEHAVDPLLGSDDGALILASLVDAARDRVLTAIYRPRVSASAGCSARAAFSRPMSRSRRGHRPARPAARTRVGEADEPLPLRGLEQLDLRREPLRPRSLRDGQLFHRSLRKAPA